MSDELLRFENLTIGYDRHPAVHHLEHRIDKGQLVAVTGPNGAGKSTLLKAIVGLLKPISGRLHLLQGVRPRDIAYLPQQADIDLSFPISAFDMVAMGLWRKYGAFRGLGREGEAEVVHALEAVGLIGFEKRPIGALSGGQMQRVLFARLLLQDAPLILLDEPFTAIDTATVRDLVRLIQRWRDEGRTVLCVLHDLDQARAYFPQAMLLARELVAAGPTVEVLTPGNLHRAHHLTEFFDENAPVCHVNGSPAP